MLCLVIITDRLVDWTNHRVNGSINESLQCQNLVKKYFLKQGVYYIDKTKYIFLSHKLRLIINCNSGKLLIITYSQVPIQSITIGIKNFALSSLVAKKLKGVEVHGIKPRASRM